MIFDIVYEFKNEKVPVNVFKVNWDLRINAADLNDTFKFHAVEKDQTLKVHSWTIILPVQFNVFFINDIKQKLNKLIEEGEPCYVSYDKTAKLVPNYPYEGEIKTNKIHCLFSFSYDPLLKSNYKPQPFGFMPPLRILYTTYLENYRYYSSMAAQVPYTERKTFEAAMFSEHPAKAFLGTVTSKNVLEAIRRIKLLNASHKNVRFVIQTNLVDDYFDQFFRTLRSKIIVLPKSCINTWNPFTINEEWYDLFDSKPLNIISDKTLREYPRIKRQYIMRKDIVPLQELDETDSYFKLLLWMQSGSTNNDQVLADIITQDNDPKLKPIMSSMYEKYGKTYKKGMLEFLGVEAITASLGRLSVQSAVELFNDIPEDNKLLQFQLLVHHPYLPGKIPLSIEAPLYMQFRIETCVDVTNRTSTYIKSTWKRHMDFYAKDIKETCPIDDLPKYYDIQNTTAMSYFNKDCRRLFEARSSFFKRLCPELTSDRVLESNQSEYIRVGFISPCLGKIHSVFRDRHGVITGMSKNPKFKTFVLLLDPPTHDVKQNYGDSQTIILGNILSQAIDKIASLSLDCLVFCELALSTIPYFIAHQRLAPLQVTTWGHSDTSGITKSIDLFISSKYYQRGQDDQEFFTEKLYLMNSLSTYYRNPSYGIPECSRQEMYEILKIKRDSTAPLWTCIQTNIKHSVPFQKAILDIATQNPDLTFVIMFEYAWDNNKKLPPNIISISRLPFITYMKLLSVTDVTLDTFPFGGCNSSLEAFSLGVPVITLKGHKLSGRFTSGFYEAMGIESVAPIADSPNSYTEIGLKFAKDEEWRNRCKHAIKNASHRLFEEKASIEEWCHLIMNSIDKSDHH